MMLCHADHVIRAGFAGLGASETGLDAVSLLLRQWAGLHDSISLAEVVDEKVSLARTKPRVILPANWMR